MNFQPPQKVENSKIWIDAQCSPIKDNLKMDVSTYTSKQKFDSK